MDERAAKEYLLKNDTRFQQLMDQHQEFEKQLGELLDKPFLSTEEQIQETVIKKKKLVLKDKMQMLIQRYQSQRTIG